MSRFGPVGPVGPVRQGNPHYGHRMRLYCRTGYHLMILPNQQVIGMNDHEGHISHFQILEFTSAGEVGEVRIRGVYTSLYLCMNSHGILYGEENPRDEGTVFIEFFYDQHNVYLSKRHKDKQWYVGIQKNGQPKIGSLTAWGQTAVQFLPIRID